MTNTTTTTTTVGSGSQLEQTVDKILAQTQNEITANIDSALKEARQSLDQTIPILEQEYEKIISDAHKEADKIKRQIVGAADLNRRNNQLLTLEDAVDRVFTQALDQIASKDRTSPEYSNLLKSLLAESTTILGSQDVVVFTSTQDRDAVASVIESDYPNAQLSSDAIDCLGGVRIQSKDGAMTFDNTLDAKIERMKPLIRKETASKFGAGN